jgi:hypothetical protein
MKREMIEIGSTIRVENGPAQKVAVATKELLDNAVTASHYQVGAFDSMGKRIVLGESMTYLDYLAEDVWYIYQLGQMGIDEDGRPLKPEKSEDQCSKVAWKAKAAEGVRMEERWIPVGVEVSKASALAIANGLAGEEY